MKHAIVLLLSTSSLFSFSQSEIIARSQGYKGPIKSVFTYNYSSDKSDSLANQQSMHPRCEVCDHFEKFNEQGQLVESQEYVILEPVSELEMGYCLNMVFTYDGEEVSMITSKKFEEHGMSFWDDSFANGTEETMFLMTKNEDSTTTEYIDLWGFSANYTTYYKNGLLIQDRDRMYYYDDENRKIKTVSLDNGSGDDQKVETWTYKDDLVSTYTSISPGSYYMGHETHYTYYDSGELRSEKRYKLKEPESDEETKLEFAHYNYENGRDSAEYYKDLYTHSQAKEILASTTNFTRMELLLRKQ